MYEGLKSYFLSWDRCPTLLKNFFDNPQPLLWLLFIQSQLKAFCKTIKKIESKNVSASEMAEELDLLVDTINRRKEENFQTTQITTLISELESEGLMTESEYLQTVNLFYDTFIEYLEKWP
jgi:hypothetical protein